MKKNSRNTEFDEVFLSKIRSFFNLSDEDSQYLKSSLKLATFKKGHVLSGRNEILQNAIFLNKGAVRTYYLEKGKEHNFSFSFSPHFVIKPQSIIETGARQFFVQSLTDTELLYIPVATLNTLRNRNSGEVYKFMNAGLISYIQYLEEQMLMLHMSAKERYEWVVERYPQLLELVSVTQLASYLNLTKETLYRIRSGKY